MGELLRKRWVWVAAVVVAIAAYFGFDALVVTDEERLEAFADVVTGDLTDVRFEAAWAYVDLGRQPIEVLSFDGVQTYDAARGSEARARARQVVQRLQGDNLRALGQSIEITDDVGVVAQRILSNQGMANIEYRLHRHGDDWLIGRVWVRR